MLFVSIIAIISSSDNVVVVVFIIESPSSTYACVLVYAPVRFSVSVAATPPECVSIMYCCGNGATLALAIMTKSRGPPPLPLIHNDDTHYKYTNNSFQSVDFYVKKTFSSLKFNGCERNGGSIRFGCCVVVVRAIIINAIIVAVITGR